MASTLSSDIHLEDDIKCPWMGILVEDVRRVIVDKMDPLTRNIFSCTSARNLTLARQGEVDMPHAPRVSRGRLAWIALIWAHAQPADILSWGANTSKDWQFWRRIVNKIRSDEEAVRMAISHRNLELAKFFHRYKTSTPRLLLETAAALGELPTMKWLVEEGYMLSEDTFLIAVVRGNLENLKWLRQAGCPLSVSVLPIAASVGVLEVMKWCQQEGCALSEDVFAAAVLCGNIENLTWLRSLKCPWDQSASNAAIASGNLGLLRWLHTDWM